MRTHTSTSLAVVYWRSKITGHTGHGQPMPEKVAVAAAAKGNREHPDIEHWAVNA
jgi:hypothetical protein